MSEEPEQPDPDERDLLGEIEAILEAHLSGRPLPWKKRFCDEHSALHALACGARDWQEFELLYLRAFPAPQFGEEGPEYGGNGGGEWV